MINGDEESKQKDSIRCKNLLHLKQQRILAIFTEVISKQKLEKVKTLVAINLLNSEGPRDWYLHLASYVSKNSIFEQKLF